MGPDAIVLAEFVSDAKECGPATEDRTEPAGSLFV